MPYKPKKPCKYPGCNQLVDAAYCPAHEIHCEDKQYERQRDKETRGWYSTRRWRLLRQQQLIRQPMCEECGRRGRMSVATEADHIKAHKGDEELFFDENNLQSLCKRCHSRKTAREDGRWKRRVYSYDKK